MQGFRPITWCRESAYGHYFIDVRRDGSAHAAFMGRGGHETIGEGGHADLGVAILACAEHERALAKTLATPAIAAEVA